MKENGLYTSQSYQVEENHEPLVSIGLPVFNGENYITEAVTSILSQTYTHFELIISDNGSTDRTEEICRAHAARDSRILFFRSETNRGAAWNFNRVFALSSGRYFQWMSHDDLLGPNFLYQAVDILEKQPEVVLVCSQVLVIDSQGEKSELKIPEVEGIQSTSRMERYASLLLVDHWCFEVFGLIRSDVLKHTPGIACFATSDRVLLTELALRGRFYRLPYYHFFSRDHSRRSIRVQSLYSRAAWFDTGDVGRFHFPHWRLLKEYDGVLRRVVASGLERTRCRLLILASLFVSMQYGFFWLFVDLVLAMDLRVMRLYLRSVDFSNGYGRRDGLTSEKRNDGASERL